MARILTRLATAVVIFLFLYLIIYFLGSLLTPVDNNSPRSSDQSLLEAEREYSEELMASDDEGVRTLRQSFVPILLLAGVSDSIGHAVILFANRVKPSRFAVTILFDAVLFLFGYLIWTTTVAIVSIVVFDQEAAFVLSAVAVGASYAPLVYGFLIALPYVGVLIANILNIVVSIVLVIALHNVFEYSLGEAVVCAFLSMIAVIAFRLTIGRPFLWLGGKLLSAVAGTQIIDNVDEAMRNVARQGEVV